MNLTNFLQNDSAFTTFALLSLLWSLPWKGIALWRASKNNSKIWFIALLVLNTIGILDIAYIFFFSYKRKKNELTETGGEL